MKILVDGDSCSVKKEIEKIAREMGIEVVMFCDYNHIIQSSYIKVKVVDMGSDMADFAIINNCKKGDIVVTNDGGLAALILAKKGSAINAHGQEYTDENINQILNLRYIRNKGIKRGNRNCKGLGGIRSSEKHTSFSRTLRNAIGRSKALAA